MKTYVIRITTIDNLYEDYIVEAKNLFNAKEQAKKVFFNEFPDANNNLKTELLNPDNEIIKEAMEIIYNGGKNE